MSHFNNLTTFLCLDCGSTLAVYGGAENSHQKYLNLCFEDEQRSYGFGKT